ncbi:DNA helicase RecD, partial [Streptomyces hydrogenans]
MTEPSGETAPEAPEDLDQDAVEEDAAEQEAAGREDAAPSSGTAGATEASESVESAGTEAADGTEASKDAAPELSEAQAELAAQRELRARIEARKAEKSGPVESGGKLSGTAADLLAAVRAVEGGSASGGAFYAPAPEPPRAPRLPETTVRPAGPRQGRLPGLLHDRLLHGLHGRRD